jgi:hypothetical protein
MQCMGIRSSEEAKRIVTGCVHRNCLGKGRLCHCQHGGPGLNVSKDRGHGTGIVEEIVKDQTGKYSLKIRRVHEQVRGENSNDDHTVHRCEQHLEDGNLRLEDGDRFFSRGVLDFEVHIRRSEGGVLFTDFRMLTIHWIWIVCLYVE